MMEKLDRPVLNVAQLSWMKALSADCRIAWLSSTFVSSWLNHDPILSCFGLKCLDKGCCSQLELWWLTAGWRGFW